MTRPEIGWVDFPTLTEELKKMLRHRLKKTPAAKRAKVRAAVDRVIECAEIIEYAENVDSVPDKVWEQTVIPFWQAYRAMTEGEYAYLFRELGDKSTATLKRDDETANNVVQTIEKAMRQFQDHIRRKWKEHNTSHKVG